MRSVYQYYERARAAISPMAWDYYDSGALDEITLRRNRTAYDEQMVLPRVLRDVSHRDQSVTVLGRLVSTPIFVAPMAFQRLAHHDGEAATARAVSEVGGGMVLSTLSTTSLSDVRRASGEQPLWFQLYVHRDRALTRDLIQQAEAEGYEALCVTVDAPLLGRRERDEHNKFELPEGMRLEALGAVTGSAVRSRSGGSGLFDYFLTQIDPSLTWRDLEWIAGVSSIPVIPKGILHPEDAAIAARMGLPAIVVSNHGGRQLDTAAATIDALSAVMTAVRSVSPELEVLVDGGIRRGSDILKALARGAQAVMVGRPILWGLGSDGAAGAADVLQILANELDLAMALSGCASRAEITEDLLAVQAGCHN